MTIQTDPYVFTNGTVANALEVNARFNNLYNLQNGGIDGTNMNLAASFAWTGQHSWAVTNTTGNTLGITANSLLTGNALSVTGNALTTGNLAYFISNSSDTSTRNLVSIINDHASATGTTCLNLRNDAANSAALTIAATNRFYVDGGFDTYFLESSANVLDFYAAGSRALRVTSGGLAIEATSKIWVDGGFDTYFLESSANEIQAITGGTAAFLATANYFYAYHDIIFPSGNRIYFDGGFDTYSYESSANTVSHFAGGVLSFTVSQTYTQSSVDLILSDAKKLYLDGGGDTYIYESAANVMTFVAGTAQALTLTSTAVTVGANEDLVISATKKFYLDGGGDTYITESSADVVTIEAGGVAVMDISNAVGTGVSIFRNLIPKTSTLTLGINGTEFDQLYLGGGGHTYFGDTSAYISGTTGAGGVIRVRQAGNGDVTLSNTSFYPTTDNIIGCGKSGNRWVDVWAVDGTINTSDGTDKDLIEDSDLGLDFIKSLRPVSYKWKDYQYDHEIPVTIVNEDGTRDEGTEIRHVEKSYTRRHYGLISQEVKEALGDKDFAGYIDDASTGKKGLRYHEFISPIIKSIQELSEKFDKITQ